MGGLSVYILHINSGVHIVDIFLVEFFTQQLDCFTETVSMKQILPGQPRMTKLLILDYFCMIVNNMMLKCSQLIGIIKI